MIQLEDSKFPTELSDRISTDYIYQISSLLKDKPVYLSGLILDLDRLMEHPEEERQELFKQILSSIRNNVGDTENKTITI